MTMMDGHGTAVEPRTDDGLFRGHRLDVAAVAFHPEGEHVLSGSEDGTVRLWNVESGREQFCLRGHTRRINAVACAPDGWLAASAGAGPWIHIWDLEEGRELAQLESHPYSTRYLHFLPDGRLLSADSWRGARVWDLEHGQAPRFFPDVSPAPGLTGNGRYAVLLGLQLLDLERQVGAPTPSLEGTALATAALPGVGPTSTRAGPEYFCRS